eukprot:scaffold3211_cov91-Skeletonema_dohrnii-CCMP3373.AAC.5
MFDFKATPAFVFSSEKLSCLCSTSYSQEYCSKCVSTVAEQSCAAKHRFVERGASATPHVGARLEYIVDISLVIESIESRQNQY